MKNEHNWQNLDAMLSVLITCHQLKAFLKHPVVLVICLQRLSISVFVLLVEGGEVEVHELNS